MHTFKKLWNATFIFVGPLWFVLVWMIWKSGQLHFTQDKAIFLCVVIPGFIVVYLSGFLIESWHLKKKRQAV